ncbi:MAG: S-layer homology domain-containing protein, partial [Firmicutes bacterium]|nr:S-layer homology domain-containing protein [Bacillota bacterium]
SFKLYAKYSAADCSVWFDSDGGTEAEHLEVKGDTVISELPVVSKEGYEFKGWKKEDGTLFKDGDKVYENLVLYAIWQPIAEEAPDEAYGFEDVAKDDWFYDDVNKVYTKGLMVGYNNSYFAPKDKIVQSNIVTILARMSGEDMAAYENTNAVNGIDEGKWYTASAKWAVSNGIINEFDANKPVLREEMAEMLSNYIKYTGMDITAVREYTAFADEAEISGDKSAAVKELFETGVISGRDGNKMAPKDTVSRAEFATVVNKICEKAEG